MNHKKTNRLSLTFLSALALTSIALSACTKAGEDSANTDPTKAHLSIGTLDAGIGGRWIEEADTRFEELHKNDSYEEGKTGVRISVSAKRTYDGTFLLSQNWNQDIMFTEGINYYGLANSGKIMDITDLMNADLSEHGDAKGTTILSKIDPSFSSFLDKDGKYYGVPFCMTICAAQHSSTDGLLMMPTAENIAWQMGVAESFGATWLSHYVYASHEEGYVCMSDLHGNAQSLYAEVAGADSSLHAYDDVSLKYEYLGTAAYDEGGDNPMFALLDHLSEATAYGGISALSASGGDALIGIYREKGGAGMAFRFTNAFASLNASPNSAYRPFTMGEIALSLTLSGSSSGTLYGEGDAQTVFAEGGSLSLTIPSYGSLFLVLS